MWILIEKHCVFIVPLYLDVDTLIWRAHKTAAVQWSWTHAIFKFHMNRRHFVLLAFQIIWITEFSFLFTHFNIKITCIEWLLKFWTLNDLKNHPKKNRQKSLAVKLGLHSAKFAQWFQISVCVHSTGEQMCAWFWSHRSLMHTKAFEYISLVVGFRIVNVLLFFLIPTWWCLLFIVAVFFIIIIIAIERCKCRCCLIFLFVRSFCSFSFSSASPYRYDIIWIANKCLNLVARQKL